MRTIGQILASLYGDEDGGRSLPERLCTDCTDDLRLVGTAMSLVNDHGLQAIVGASNDVARRLEELQFELGEGPAVEAATQLTAAALSDVGVDGVDRWPVFAPAALDAGVRGIVALPLQVGAIRMGGLTLYDSEPGRARHDELPAALAYAEAAVILLLNLHSQTAADGSLHPSLDGPVQYRAEVHQATGFVSVQASVNISDALMLLRAHAFASEAPLLDVARDVLARRINFADRSITMGEATPPRAGSTARDGQDDDER